MSEKGENNWSVGGLGFALLVTWILYEMGLPYLLFFLIALIVGSAITGGNKK
jgi:hypothetical protein